MCAASPAQLEAAVVAAPEAPAAASATLELDEAAVEAPAAASAAFGTSCNHENGNLRSFVNHEPLPNQVVGLKY